MVIDIKQGDCLELMKDIPDGSVDMILADLPYETTALSWDTIIPFEPLWEQYERIIKDNGAIVLTASQPFTTKLIHSKIELYKYNWVWKKAKPTGFSHSKNMPLKDYEDIVVFCFRAVLFRMVPKPWTTSGSCTPVLELCCFEWFQNLLCVIIA